MLQRHLHSPTAPTRGFVALWSWSVAGSEPMRRHQGETVLGAIRGAHNPTWEGCALPNPPAGGLCSPQTVMRMAPNAAMTIMFASGKVPSGTFLCYRRSTSPQLYTPTQPACSAVEVLEMKAGWSSGSEPRLSTLYTHTYNTYGSPPHRAASRSDSRGKFPR